MTRPTITIDAALFDVAIEEITDVLIKGPECDLLRRTSWALGVLRSISVLRTETMATGAMTTQKEACRAECDALREAIARAGYRCDIDMLHRVALFPVAPNAPSKDYT